VTTLTSRRLHQREETRSENTQDVQQFSHSLDNQLMTMMLLLMLLLMMMMFLTHTHTHTLNVNSHISVVTNEML